MKKKAIVVITYDDVNDYFLFIDHVTGQEIARRSTEDYGTWSYDDGYDSDKMLNTIAEQLGVEVISIIHW